MQPDSVEVVIFRNSSVPTCEGCLLLPAVMNVHHGAHNYKKKYQDYDGEAYDVVCLHIETEGQYLKHSEVQREVV